MSGPRALGTLRGWLGALLPLFVVGGAFLTEFGTGLTATDMARLPESLAEAILLGGFIVGFGVYLVRAAPRAPLTSSAPAPGAPVPAGVSARQPTPP